MAWTTILPEVVNSIATRVDAATCPAGYLKDKVLWHDGDLYQCQEDITAETAWTDATKLKPVILADLFGKQLTAGEPWDNTKAYHKNDVVQKDDFLWICNVENATVGTFSKEAGSQRKQFNMSETDLGNPAAGTLMPAAIGAKYHVHEIEFPAEYADDFANGSLWITNVDVKSGGSEYTNKRIESTTISGVKCANITGASITIYPGITPGKYYIAGPNAYAGPNSPTWFKIDIASDPEWSKYYVHEASGSDIRKNIAEIEDSSKTYETGDTIWESETDLKYVDDAGSKQDVNIRSMIEAVVDYLREYSGLDIKWGWDSTNNLPILKAEKAWDFIKYYDFSTSLSGAPATDTVFYGAVVLKSFDKLTVINSKPDMYSVGIVGTHINSSSGSSELQRFERLVANMNYDNTKNMYLLKDPSVSFGIGQPYTSDSATKYSQDSNGRSYFYTSNDFTYSQDGNIGLGFVTIKKVGGGTISSDEVKDIYESINYNVVPRSADYTLGNLT